MFCTKVCCTQWDSTDDTNFIFSSLLFLQHYRSRTLGICIFSFHIQTTSYNYFFQSSKCLMYHEKLTCTVTILYFFHFYHWFFKQNIKCFFTIYLFLCGFKYNKTQAFIYLFGVWCMLRFVCTDCSIITPIWK